MASDINTITLTGRLTRDAETKSTQSGVLVINFGIAVNESRKRGDDWETTASFFDCVAFDKTTEATLFNLVKGAPVLLTGKLKQDTWQTQEGKQASKISIVVNSIAVLASSNESRVTKQVQSNIAPNAKPVANTAFDEDIPF